MTLNERPRRRLPSCHVAIPSFSLPAARPQAPSSFHTLYKSCRLPSLVSSVRCGNKFYKSFSLFIVGFILENSTDRRGNNLHVVAHSMTKSTLKKNVGTISAMASLLEIADLRCHKRDWNQRSSRIVWPVFKDRRGKDLVG